MPFLIISWAAFLVPCVVSILSLSSSAIGSGGQYALAAARALIDNTDLPARKIAEEAMRIAGKICIYTNDTLTVEEL